MALTGSRLPEICRETAFRTTGLRVAFAGLLFTERLFIEPLYRQNGDLSKEYSALGRVLRERVANLKMTTSTTTCEHILRVSLRLGFKLVAANPLFRQPANMSPQNRRI